MNNILLISGKEEVVRVELTESLIKLDEVTIRAGQHKGEPLNQLAAVSARSFTMEETKRYAGSFDDPARMAASYDRVTADPGGGNASFLVNYCYSTLAMFNAVGMKIAGDAVPEFQDLTFHLNLPAKKAGTFSIFGLGGINKIYEEYSDWINDFGTDMGVFGVKHLYILNSKTYINTTLAMTASRNNWWHQRQIDSDAFQLTNREHFTYRDYRGSIIVNHKINPKHYLKTGFTYDDSKFDLFTDFYDRDDSVMVREVDQKGRTGHWQAYGSWR
ncbi:MAG: hypothetical protein AMS26_08135 [Bacteroides sp. SM23_62]|nr:MAG: hypothetical protein AMS26_08135 [Bacteroides sp. SM23_62]